MKLPVHPPCCQWWALRGQASRLPVFHPQLSLLPFLSIPRLPTPQNVLPAPSVSLSSQPTSLSFPYPPQEPRSKELEPDHFPHLSPDVCQGWAEHGRQILCLLSPASWLGIGSCTCCHLRFKGQRGHGLFPVYGRLLFPYQFYLSPSSCPCLSCAPDNFLFCVLWSELDEMPPSPARVISFSICPPINHF